MSVQSRPRTAARQTAILSAVMALAVGTAMPAWADGEKPAAAPASTTPEEAQWQAHKLHFDFMGFTSHYTCDGLEGKVRQILATFGARKDMTVTAYGCPDLERPSRMISVDAQFNALAPLPAAGAAGANPAEPVKAQWVQVRLAPRRPSYMDEGECELVEQIHDLLQKGFALRNAEYHTSCVPHQVTPGDYSVRADVMKPVAN